LLISFRGKLLQVAQKNADIKTKSYSGATRKLLFQRCWKSKKRLLGLPQAGQDIFASWPEVDKRAGKVEEKSNKMNCLKAIKFNELKRWLQPSISYFAGTHGLTKTTFASCKEVEQTQGVHTIEKQNVKRMDNVKKILAKVGLVAVFTFCACWPSIILVSSWHT
jgi:hypothetical protein